MHDLHVIPGVWTVTVGYDTLFAHLRDRFALTPYDPQQPDRPANLIAFAYDSRCRTGTTPSASNRQSRTYSTAGEPSRVTVRRASSLSVTQWAG